MAKTKNKGLKILISIIALLVVIAVAIGWYIKSTVFKPLELAETTYIYITPSTEYEEVAAQIKEKANLPSDKIFEMVSERMNYPLGVKPGRYAIKNGMTVPEMIRMLRSGNQTAAKLTFNNMRTKEAPCLSHAVAL